MNLSKSPFTDDLIKFALLALVIVLPIRAFIAQPFIVRGASMEPTFEGGDYLIVDQLSYRLHPPERGDVVIMRYPKDPSVFFIKRIIGLPGETVELVGDKIIIERPGDAPSLTLDQSYIAPGHVENEYGVYHLGSNEYFVMGDNRTASSDSRSWGALPRRDIVGRALVRLYPPKEWALYPGQVLLPQ